MGRVAEADLIGVDADPLGAQAAGDVATDAGGQPLDDDEPDGGGSAQRDGRGTFRCPW